MRLKALKMEFLREKAAGLLSSRNSERSLAGTGFQKAPTEKTLFPTVSPEVDGDDCDHDCSTCTVSYPRKFAIDEDDKLYGHVKRWDTHIVVGTGKSDWVRDVADEKGSVMEAVDRYGTALKNGRCMLSASNMPTGDVHGEVHGGKDGAEGGTTRVLILPAWKMADGITPADVPSLMEAVEKEATNASPMKAMELPVANGTANGAHDAPEDEDTPDVSALQITKTESATNGVPPTRVPKLSLHACPHRAIILMCSQKTRDARCGQSAPLLRKEFERILRPMGLYRDLQDERPGGVGIYFISHVGGHKYSANVMIYRREGRKQEGTDEEIDGAPMSSEAVQGIWLARVRPEDCEGIVKFTVLQGKVVKPERQLRGGFDREKGLVSW